MNILITGIAGFMGSHLGKRLLARGDRVVGIDNLNDYYDVNLKKNRLDLLLNHPEFEFLQMDITDQEALTKLFSSHQFDVVVNLAAQAGVRYAVNYPRKYVNSNFLGFFNIINLCNEHHVKHFVFASSSSVYGRTNQPPFSENDDTNHPTTIYAASKKANELIAHSYAYLHKLPCTGLRYFTIYGPFGRPDMAVWQMTQKTLENTPVDIFNNGETTRSFTYIDDAVDGTISAIDQKNSNDIPYRIYNIGYPTQINLLSLLEIIENAVGKKMIKNFLPAEHVDILESFADISLSKNELGFSPKTSLKEGIQKFVDWYVKYKS